MKTFKEYLFENNKEEKLDEGFAEILTSIGIGTGGFALGTLLAGLAVYGAVFIVYGYSKAQSKIIISITKLWRSLKSLISGTKDFINDNETDVKDVIKDAQRDPKVIKALDRMDIVKQKYLEDLNDVIDSVSRKQWKEAKKRLLEKDDTIKNNPVVKNIIIGEIVKVTGEPVMFVASPGNESFRAVKDIFDLKTAKFASDATVEFLKKNLMEKDE